MWGAIAAVAGPVIGGLIGADAAENAAAIQAGAANNASATQLAMFNQNRADSAPWRDAGVNALGRLTTGLGTGGEYTKTFSPSELYSDPGYGFRLDEGRKAIEKSAAARGLLLSGGSLKGIERYGQDYASNEYTNAFNRFQLDQSNRFNRNAAIAGLGQTAVQQLGAQGLATAGQIGQNTIGAGNANASGYVGAANALSGGLTGAYNNYASGQLLNKLFPQSKPSPSNYNPGAYGYYLGSYNPEN